MLAWFFALQGLVLCVIAMCGRTIWSAMLFLGGAMFFGFARALS